MIVVADTSPLNYLVQLRHIDLLPRLYTRVIIPSAVLMEMQHAKAPTKVRTWASAPPSWLDLRSVTHLDAGLSAELGPGEREAISLALELGASALLIDEAAGRREAKVRRIAVAGTLAVLLQSALRDYLNLADELEKLRHLNFRFSAELEGETLATYERLRLRRFS